MFYIRHQSDGPAFILAMASAGTPVVFGLGLDDIKWLISVSAAFVGAAVALYIHARGEIETARLRREVSEEEQRRRQKLLDWEQRLLMREVELAKTAPAAGGTAPPG